MFTVKIVTPKGVKAEINAQYVGFTTIEGGMGVLTDRLPIVTKLSIAPVIIREPTGKEHLFAVYGGILEMDGKELIILTTDAERPEEIDVETTMKAIEQAKRIISEATSEVEKAKARATLEKNIARLKVVKK